MNSDELKNIATVVTAITALLAAILALFQKLGEFWNKILFPALKFIGFGATLIVPNGTIVWFFFDQTARVSTRLTEQPVIIALVVQLTVSVSVYALFWGLWILPRVIFLTKHHELAKSEETEEDKVENPITESANVQQLDTEDEQSKC
ncbi:MAG: hypothetical protein IPM53_20880 [Anaerolineaceae bacterium]|nr:hypothetical protein [Anaerolineaceae bacterium]